MPIAQAAVKAGYQVSVATHIGEVADKIRAARIDVIATKFGRDNRHLWLQWRALLEIRSILRSNKPDIFHCVGLKAVIFGMLASLGLSVRHRVCLLPGLGVVFTSDRLRFRLMKHALRSICRFLFEQKGCSVIVQNRDDFSQINKLAPKSTVHLIRGSGVDTELFKPTFEPAYPIVVSLVARMLWHKGVGEFVEAARVIKAAEFNLKFYLVGGIDLLNPAGIQREQLTAWENAGHLTWLDHQDDIGAIWRRSHIAVLPSYREGLPKSLLEAAACGKPIVAADTPGCREIVQHGVNGLLVPVKDAGALAEAILTLALDSKLRAQMGLKSRQLVTENFSKEQVAAQTLRVYHCHPGLEPGSSVVQGAGPRVDPGVTV